MKFLHEAGEEKLPRTAAEVDDLDENVDEAGGALALALALALTEFDWAASFPPFDSIVTVAVAVAVAVD